MSNQISPENERFIEHQLDCGAYQSREELLDEAVRLLKRRRELKGAIQAGIESGPSVSADDVFRRLERNAG